MIDEWLYARSCLKDVWSALTRSLCAQISEQEVACLEQARNKVEEALVSIKNRKPDCIDNS